MAATEPKTMEQWAESLLVPQESEEQEVDAENVEDAQTDEAPDAELTDEEEAEADTDDAEAEGEDDGQEDDDDPEEDAGLEELPDTTLVRVKVDGEEREIPLADLKQSYSGQGYIQKGMQEAAAKRKEAEAVFQQLQQERQTLSQLLSQVQQQGFAPPQKPDPALLQKDPIGYMEQQAAYEQAKADYDSQQAQLAQYQEQQTAAQRQAMQAYVREQMDLMQKAIPELADAEQAGQVQKALVATGEAYGYSQEEIAGIMDHRAVKVLNDARKWRELQRTKATKKADKSRPAVKPKPTPQQSSAKARREKQMKRLQETGRMEDAVSLLINPED